jgi:hypothetical protein
MRSVLIIAVLSVLSNTLPAEDAESIVWKADDLLISPRTYSESEITVYRSDKPRPTMRVETYDMRRADTGHSLTIYTAPAKMRGTAYLTIGDDLWVRFGSTGRVRKLSSSAKKNSAGGTDFSYSDMGESGQGVATKYIAKMGNSNAMCSGSSCWEIHLFPKPNTEGTYEKLVAFIAKENFHYLKIDYYEAGANIKTLFLEDYRAAGEKAYPYRVTMESHVKPSRTEVITTAIQFDSAKVQDSYFTTSYLQRIR